MAAVRKTLGLATPLRTAKLERLFESMREAADADPSTELPQSLLLPFVHLRIQSMGGVQGLGQRGRAALALKRYLAVLVQSAVLLLNLSLLLRSLRSSFFSAVGTLETPPVHGYLQVGFLSTERRKFLVSAFEGLGLLYHLSRLLQASLLVGFGKCSEEAGYRQWQAVAEVCWELLPALRTFSALRMLRSVHPQLLPMELGALLKSLQLQRARGSAKLLRLLLFAGQRLLILYFGFQAFIFKFTTTANRLEANHDLPVLQLIVSFAFLNQLLGGIVQLEKLMRNRVLLVLFGGEDAYVDVEEAALMKVWLALVARALFLQAGGGIAAHGWRLRYFVAMSSFNHMDLQRMVLAEDQNKVEERHGHLHRFQERATTRKLEEVDPKSMLQNFLDDAEDLVQRDSHRLLGGD